MNSHDIRKFAPLMGPHAFGVYYQLHEDTVGFHTLDVKRSVRTLMKQTGMSVNTVLKAIKRLERLGFIRVIRKGYQTLNFTLLHLVRTVERGFQFVESFLKRLGVTFKVKEEPVSREETPCLTRRNTNVSPRETYKERNKNLNNEPFFKTPIEGGGVVSVDEANVRFAGDTSSVGEKILAASRKFGRSQYAEAMVYAGPQAAAIVKQFGGWHKVCKSNTEKSYFIEKELNQIGLRL